MTSNEPRLPSKKPKISSSSADYYKQTEFDNSLAVDAPPNVLFDAESETKRYQISIIAKGQHSIKENENQTSSMAFHINCALHNIVDGKTFIFREKFDRPAIPVSSHLVKVLGEDIKTSGSKVILQVTTKFNCKYRIEANLSIRLSEKLVENSEDTAPSSIPGKSVRKELELVPDEQSTDVSSNHHKHVWRIKTEDEDSQGTEITSGRKKINFFSNDDTSLTLAVQCEIVITNHSSLNGLNLHTVKAGTTKKCLENAIQSCKDVGMLLKDAFSKDQDSSAFAHLSDIELVCEGKSFKCHKLLLSITSKVFAKRFLSQENLMLIDEVSGKEVFKIDDFDAETVGKMIQFIYKGSLTKRGYASVRLLTLANKYEILRLKLNCEASLIDTLDIENAILLWLLAKDNDSRYLQGASEEFMYDYWDRGFQNTEEFKNLNPKHAMEILSSIIAIAKGANEP